MSWGELGEGGGSWGKEELFSLDIAMPDFRGRIASGGWSQKQWMDFSLGAVGVALLCGATAVVTAPVGTVPGGLCSAYFGYVAAFGAYMAWDAGMVEQEERWAEQEERWAEQDRINAEEPTEQDYEEETTEESHAGCRDSGDGTIICDDDDHHEKNHDEEELVCHEDDTAYPGNCHLGECNDDHEMAREMCDRLGSMGIGGSDTCIEAVQDLTGSRPGCGPYGFCDDEFNSNTNDNEIVVDIESELCKLMNGRNADCDSGREYEVYIEYEMPNPWIGITDPAQIRERSSIRIISPISRVQHSRTPSTSPIAQPKLK